MSLGGLYLDRHRTQYDGVAADVESGCTWTTVANGADAVTAGRISRSPSQVHALVKRTEETDSSTPGWSIPDAVLAAHRLGLVLVNHTGEGWAGVEKALAAGLYVVLQGDSDQFGNGTCSGNFNGDHCVGIHPAHRVGQHWIDDPICPTGRWESDYILRRYAEKLDPRVRFAAFATPVPKATTPPPASPSIVTTGPAVSGSFPVLNLNGLDVSSNTVVRLAQGQPLFNRPNGKRVTAMTAAGAVRVVARVYPGWLCIRVRTKGGWSDGIARDTGLYVPAAAGPTEAL